MRDPTAPWRGYLELRKHDYVNIGFLEENIELEIQPCKKCVNLIEYPIFYSKFVFTFSIW
jgi:hypothetical protein